MRFAERMLRLEGVGFWDATHYRVLALFCVGVMISNFSADAVCFSCSLLSQRRNVRCDAYNIPIVFQVHVRGSRWAHLH